MPPRTITESSGPGPEAKGLRYDECELALFRAKVSYCTTIEERTAMHNPNIASISNTQAQILKCWEIQMQNGREMAGLEEGRSANDMRAMLQYEWRYKALETAAIKAIKAIENR